MTSAAEESRPEIAEESRQSLYAAAGAMRQRARELTTRAIEIMVYSATLQRESAALVEISARLRTELRGNIAGYAATMRQLGESAGRVVVTVTRIADEAGRAQPWSDSAEIHALRADLVRWTVDGYYGATA